MDAPAAIEVIVMSAITSETKASGKVRKVTFLLSNDEGEHPFAGMVGDRLHLVCVRINDDETSGAVLDQDGDRATASVASPSATGREVVEHTGDRGGTRDSTPEHNARPRPEVRAAGGEGKRDWADLPPAQQAAIRCQELSFRRFLSKEKMLAVADPDEAAERVREQCCVASRRELNDNHKARVLWHQLDREFLEWSGRLAHAR